MLQPEGRGSAAGRRLQINSHIPCTCVVWPQSTEEKINPEKMNLRKEKFDEERKKMLQTWWNLFLNERRRQSPQKPQVCGN